MTLSHSEQQLLHDIDNKLVLLTERQEKQFETQDKIKVRMDGVETTLYKNGLNSRVKELHEWMLEQKEAKRKEEKLQTLDDQQEHEIKLMGIKMSAELKSKIITGFITGSMALLGVILSK